MKRSKFSNLCRTSIAAAMVGGNLIGLAPPVAADEGLSGGIDDWIASVCEGGLFQQGGTGVFMPSASGGLRCSSRKAVAGANYTIIAGYYSSRASADHDLALDHGGNRLGAFAQGKDPSSGQFVIFALRGNDPAKALAPLERFGFTSGSAVPPAAVSKPSEEAGGATVGSTNPATHLSFRSQTGSVVCEMYGTKDGGSAVCEVPRNSYAKQVKPECNGDMTTRFDLVRGHPVDVTCYGSPTFREERAVADYGKSLTVGSITCTVERDAGVICKDATTGHFFQAARNSYQWR